MSGFSALQRAENSSMRLREGSPAAAVVRFQCSSASRKFLNQTLAPADLEKRVFQCSSASRKFLNSTLLLTRARMTPRFSALQRAENSSIQCSTSLRRSTCCSFQCSSASRKFLNYKPQRRKRRHRLFQCSSASRKFLNRNFREIGA